MQERRSDWGKGLTQFTFPSLQFTMHNIWLRLHLSLYASNVSIPSRAGSENVPNVGVGIQRWKRQFPQKAVRAEQVIRVQKLIRFHWLRYQQNQHQGFQPRFPNWIGFWVVDW